MKKISGLNCREKIYSELNKKNLWKRQLKNYISLLLYYFIASATLLLPQYRAKNTLPPREFLVYLIRIQCNPDGYWRKKRIARRQIGHQVLSTCVPPVKFVLSSEIKKLMGRNFRANPPKNDGRDATNKPQISRNLNEIFFRSFITVAWRLSFATTCA